ncbi:phosphotransferase [Bacillus spongiae]|uniref:Phosphotransferase n=1 Tax=Bacillus spongiae TaxID=2683610 RepID=A0ABU8HAZ9_9BACI
MKLTLEAERWIKREVENVKAIPTATMEEIKATDLTVIQKISTNKGTFYYKDSGTIAKFEGKLAHHLHSFYSDKSVEVTAFHPAKPWLLMKELQGQPLREVKDKKVWKQALQEYAELQVNETKHVEQLIQLGVPDRRLPILKREIQSNLNEMCQTGLSHEKTVTIMNIQEELLEMCDKIEGIVPCSLDHGDLHSGNIQLVEGKPIFFDWGDAAVTHPFFSTRVFWNVLHEWAQYDSEWLTIINEFRPSYLEPWTKFAPMKELEEILKISDQLACVYRGLGWLLYINRYRANIEESEQRPAQWLEVLLEHRELVNS